jgi:hypothetical protein
MDLSALGRLLLLVALGLAFFGGLLLLVGKLTGGQGLPGDVRYDGERVKVYVPWVTSIILSLVLTLVLNLFIWLARRGR